MAAKLAGQIIRINKQIDATVKKVAAVKDRSAREEAAFHAGLMLKKAGDLGRALSAGSLFNRLSSHHTGAAKKKRK